MSFLGAKGFVMDVNGLKELLSLVYAHSSVKKILTSHVYTRAIRAHLASSFSLCTNYFDKTAFSPEEKQIVGDLFPLLDSLYDKCHETIIQPFLKKFNSTIDQLE